MMVMHGAHLLHFASRLQKTVALSSGEAELNAQVMGATEGLEWPAYVKNGIFVLTLPAFATAARLVGLRVAQEWAK